MQQTNTVHGTMEPSANTAPFIAKTYQMVNDPSSDRLVAWGRADNSFVVADPIDFSRHILPAYFKHNNFSSFVRQLNTYGFRKVDPDRWEFANQWFLRGQNNLLHNIVRRKQSRNAQQKTEPADMDDDELITEITHLREEQRVLEEELKGMNRRLEATEHRPQQMMAFLCKVVEDPELIPRMMIENKDFLKSRNQLQAKKRRLVINDRPASSSSSSSMALSGSVKSEEDDDGAIGMISSPEEAFDMGNFCRSLSPMPEALQSYPMIGYDTMPLPGIGGQTGAEVAGLRPPQPYPFLFLGSGF